MTGVIATSLAVGVIAVLMAIGIRQKPVPPDPDWRDHLPQPVPAPHWFAILFVGRYVVFLTAFVAGASGHVGWFAALFCLSLGVLAFQTVWTIDSARAQRRRSPTS
ncbi:MAG TPA: hypothetical protein VK646_05925 [Actinomycetota bacterium]|nr:hypothetical protein [Actinomycetota bacterium]